MIVLNKPYTDRHGITFPKAVIVVMTANYAVSRSSSLVANIAEGEVTYQAVNSHESLNVGFTASLYASEAAYQQGLDSMPFKDNFGSEYHSFTLPVDTVLTQEAIISACEQTIRTMVNA